MTVEVTQGGGRSVAFITLGCAKNEVDSEKMRAKAKAAGYHIEQDPEKADAVVINTCSFIQSATEESLETIFEAAGMENVASGDAKLIVAGCMPARYGDELEAELTEACAFVPCSKEDDLGDILNALFGGSPERAAADDDSDDEPSSVSAYVKISDGCDRFCSYCAIPYIRGRYHSFALEVIDREVAAHVAKGAREIVLIAQDTGRWGQDFEEPSSCSAYGRACAALPVDVVSRHVRPTRGNHQRAAQDHSGSRQHLLLSRYPAPACRQVASARHEPRRLA